MSLILIGLSVLLGGCASSKTATSDAETFFAVIVSDMPTALKWYEEVLDLEVLSNVTMADKGFKQAILENDHIHVELVQMSSATNSADEYKVGFFTVGIAISDFDERIERLQSSGVTFGGKVMVGQTDRRQVLILDPDGNRIHLFEK